MANKDFDFEEKDEEEMTEEEPREMPDGLESQTGYCRFCGQAKIIHTMIGWTQEAVDEAVTEQCECEDAKAYAEAKARKEKAKKRIVEIFGEGAGEKAISPSVVDILLDTVDAIEEKGMKGITVDVGKGVRAKVNKMAKESIKVERSETTKATYEE